MDIDILAVTLILILADLLTGFCGAVKEKDVQSGKLREGLWHKAGFIGLIGLAYVIEYAAANAELGFDVPSVLAVCIYIIVTEIVSVFENLCILNPELVKSPLGSLFKHTPKVEEGKN